MAVKIKFECEIEYNGNLYKVARNHMIFRWSADEWMRATLSPRDVISLIRLMVEKHGFNIHAWARFYKVLERADALYGYCEQ